MYGPVSSSPSTCDSIAMSTTLARWASGAVASASWLSSGPKIAAAFEPTACENWLVAVDTVEPVSLTVSTIFEPWSSPEPLI